MSSRRTTLAQQRAEQLLGGAVAVAAAVSTQRAAGVQEARRAGRAASCSSVSRPQVIVPSPSRETRSPDRPTYAAP